MNQLIINTKAACRELRALTDEKRREVLGSLAAKLKADRGKLLGANAEDLSRMDPESPLYDRLQLTPVRIDGIADGVLQVAGLPSPLGRILEQRTLPNGLHLEKVSAPYGVIGVIYEARPNVTFDVFAICFKSGNACLLKGGRDASCSNRAAVGMIKEALRECGVTEDAVNLMDATHEAAAELLGAVGFVDIVIPRGGRKLIDFVRSNALVPCIETGAGVVNTYFDASGDLEIGRRCVLNAKTRRVSVCNALDCLLVHSSRLDDLFELVAPLAEKQVTIYADERSYGALCGRYPLLERADDGSYGTEYMDYKMALRCVDSLGEAMEHIARYGSGHSESIITDDASAAEVFLGGVDAACVYHNAPTSFTDGGEFGLGAEIGISTQKLGPRGPMGLQEMTCYKWLITGSGQMRP